MSYFMALKSNKHAIIKKINALYWTHKICMGSMWFINVYLSQKINKF